VVLVLVGPVSARQVEGEDYTYDSCTNQCMALPWAPCAGCSDTGYTCGAGLPGSGNSTHHSSGFGNNGPQFSPNMMNSMDVGRDLSDPVNLWRGEFTLQQTDLTVPGVGLSFVFERFYRSIYGWTDRYADGTYAKMRDTFGMPNNWSHSYCIFLVRSPGFYTCGTSITPDVQYKVHMPNGDVVDMYPAKCDANKDFYEWWNARFAAKLVLEDGDPDHHRLAYETADGTQYHFFGWADGENPAWPDSFDGLLEYIEDRFGNRMYFEYVEKSAPQTNGDPYVYARLWRIKDTEGRYYTFGYDEFLGATDFDNYQNPNRLVHLEDFAGRRVEFTTCPRVEIGLPHTAPEGRPNDLIKVTYKSGGTAFKDWQFRYAWDPENTLVRSLDEDLTQVLSPHGESLLTNHYYGGGDRFDAIGRQDTPAGRYDYVPLANFLAADNEYYMPTAVINPNGQVKLLIYGMKSKALHARLDYTGLIQDADRDGFIHKLRYVGGTLPINPSFPLPTELGQHRVRSGLDPNFYSQVNGYTPLTVRLARAERADGGAVETAYEHDDHFNEWDPFRSANMTYRKRTPPPGTGGQPIEEFWEYIYSQGSSGCGCASGFPSKYTDPNGNVTKYDRNPNNGNLDHVHYGWSESNGVETSEATESFEYDWRGRITSHTRPDNGTGYTRADTFSYYGDDEQNVAARGQLRESVIDSAGLGLTTSYVYDSFGYVSEITDPNDNITEYINDPRGLVIEETRKDALGAVLARTKYRYRADDSLLRIDVDNRNADGTLIVSNPEWTTIREYDALGRVTRIAREAEAVTIDPAQITAESPASLVTDPKWQVAEFEYDGLSNVVEIRKGEAIQKSVGGVPQPYDEFNVVRRIYDERNLLYMEIRGGDETNSSATRFDYDLDGNLIRRYYGFVSLSEPGAITEFAYDGFDRRFETTLPDGTLLRVDTYDANGNRIAESVVGPYPTDAGSLVATLSTVTRVFDKLDRVTSETWGLFDVRDGLPLVPAATTTTTAYNPDSSVHSVTDPRNNTTVYLYDTAGRLAEVLYPAAPEGASSVVYTYDNNGNTMQVSQHDAVGGTGSEQVFITRYEYDALDRMTKSIQDLNGATDNVTEYRHDSRGLVVGMTDPRTKLSAYEYDGLGRLVRTTRDMNGNGPDPLEAADLVTTQTWDHSSRLIAQTDDNGNPTRYAYDSLDRLIMTRYADGTLDRVGSGGDWTLNTPRPNLTTPPFVSGYDRRGNAVQFRDPNGSVVTTTFDSRNRPVSRSISRGTGVLGRTQEFYAYDGLSRVWRARDDFTTIKRAYDSAGRMMRESFGVDEFGGFPILPSQSVDYEHDEAGNTTKITYPGGTVVDQTFDALNRLSTVKMTPSGGAQIDAASYVYAGPSRVSRRVHGNGTEISYAYNGQSGAANATGDRGFRQVSQVTSFPTATPIAEIDRRTLQWDAAQNKTRLTRNIDGLIFQRTFFYDAANRLELTNYRGITAASYALDGVHNRLSVYGTIESGAQIGQYTMGPNDAPVNQYTTTPWHFVDHDENGNLVRLRAQASGGLMLDLAMGPGAGPQSVYDSAAQAIALGGIEADVTGDAEVAIDDLGVMQELVDFGGVAAGAAGGAGGGGGPGAPGGGPVLPPFGAIKVAALRYDYRNQMVEYEDDEYPGQPHQYIYDLFGRRLWSSVFFYPGTGGRENTLHLYAGNTASAASWQVAREQVQSPEGAIAEYCYGNYIDEVLVMRRDADGAGAAPAAHYTYHQDDLFNVVALTDDSGAVAERYEYFDYGVPVVTLPDGSEFIEGSQVGNRWMFEGREWRAESRLYGFRTRYLEPTMGRFTSKDWIGVWGDIGNLGSRQAFCWSMPITLVDPWGLDSFYLRPTHDIIEKRNRRLEQEHRDQNRQGPAPREIDFDDWDHHFDHAVPSESFDDAIKQLEDMIKRGIDIDSIAIGDHGNVGYQQLGEDDLYLLLNDPRFEKLLDLLKDDGELHLYGCNFAASDKVKELLRKLAQKHGVRIRASDHPVWWTPGGKKRPKTAPYKHIDPTNPPPGGRQPAWGIYPWFLTDPLI